MSNRKIYQIDLKPLDVFFFGGEQHFGEEDEKNYFVRSNFYPQQSGVLGMLRHQLLIQNNCIPITKDNMTKASDLIGGESYNIGGNSISFGAILNISPLFISKESKLLFPEASEYYINKKNAPNELTMISPDMPDGQTLIYPERKSEYVISVGKNYLGKYEIKELLVSKQGEKLYYKYERDFESKDSLPANGIFIETGKPGIQKSLRKQKGLKDQGFYKQYSWSFPSNVCFTFFAEIDHDIAKTFESGRIMLGGEKSAFHMVVKEYTEAFSPFDESSAFYSGLYDRPHQSLNKIVCLSDCIASDELANKLVFMTNTMVDYRNSRTKVGRTSNYNRMSTEKKDEITSFDSPTRSLKYQLIKRGSVLWVDDPDLAYVEKHLKQPQHRAIGYNYFKTILK